MGTGCITEKVKSELEIGRSEFTREWFFTSFFKVPFMYQSSEIFMSGFLLSKYIVSTKIFRNTHCSFVFKS